MRSPIVIASKSAVRKQILEESGLKCEVIIANIDEDSIKNSLLQKGANPTLISKNLAELKSIKVSEKTPNKIIIGADSVIDLNGKLINKPRSREEAKKILLILNGKTHSLISSVCISKNGSMIWNCTDKSNLKMKKLDEIYIEDYLKKIDDKTLYAYGVYQIEGIGRNLFEKIEGNESSIMGLPIKQINKYLNTLE